MRRSTILAITMAALALQATGCYRATFIRDSNVQRGVENDEWRSFFLWGLVGDQVIDVHEFCPDGNVAEIATGGNFGTGFVEALTLGLYAPRKIYVTCARGSRLTLVEDPSGRLVAEVAP